MSDKRRIDEAVVRRAQAASRNAFLRREAERQGRAAAAVLQAKLRELEQGVDVPQSVAEAEVLLRRAEEVRAASGLLSAAQHRRELAGEQVTSALSSSSLLPTRRADDGSEHATAAVATKSAAATSTAPSAPVAAHDAVAVTTAATATQHRNSASATATTSSSPPPPPPSSLLAQDADDNAFIALDATTVAARLARHDYVAEQTVDDLHEAKVAALQDARAHMQAQRRRLPIYAMRSELLQTIAAHPVVVLVGETGSGKTTQLLQYLYEEQMHVRRRHGARRHEGVAGNSSSSNSRKGDKDDNNNSDNEDDDEDEELRLVCTQPRRIAAVSVAERVAHEMGCRCGSLVGYRVRFEDKTSPATRLLYMTDGMALREFANDPHLRSVAAVMIDEAHERSVNTDLLLGLLRDVLRRNARLKVIVASATINARRFSAFFDQAPVCVVRGRSYPVDVYYAAAPVADYIAESAQTVLSLHLSKPLPGDVLVFLPGQDSIEACAEQLRRCVAEAGAQVRPLLILPVYAAMPPHEQARIYERTAPGTRKVVIATNLAETSITIDGVVYVVDCGLCKQNFYNARALLEELRVVPTSQASATQRAGRAGRTQRGECYRLYTAYTFHNELPGDTLPEVLRCSLASVVLQLKTLGVDNLLRFDFVDAPSSDALERALDQLYLLGAMRADGRLTVTGRRMAEFPLEPALSKVVLRGCALGCGRHAAMAAAMLTLESVFVNTRDARTRQTLDSAREQLFAFGNGDVAGYVNVLESWLHASSSSSSFAVAGEEEDDDGGSARFTAAGGGGAEFCRTHCIHPRTLLRARDVLDQLLKTCTRIGVDVDDNNANKPAAHTTTTTTTTSSSRVINVELLTRALLSGYFFNVARLEADKRSYRVVRPMDTGTPASHTSPYSYSNNSSGDDGDDANGVAELHPSSYLFRSTGKQRTATSAALAGAPCPAPAPAAARERPSLVVFTQLRRTTRRFMMHVTAIDDVAWVLESAPVNYFSREELETKLRKRERH